MMKRNKISKAIIVFFPSVTMLSITSLTFAYINNISGVALKNMFIASLVLLFPILFLLQGVFCATNALNIFVSLGISILTYSIILITYLNTFAFMSFSINVISGMLGYALGKRFIRITVTN
ncbi:hypothetical protein [Bacillus massiliigorillae]|uniref:hypothetical protein n=1 Tax=Bacillus massiliigorillae TaxID=1243664 RepID=UPI0012B5C82B|nr:hypothetical protein [Bacillus massiliigorillae]